MEIENLRRHKSCVGTHLIVHINYTCKLGPQVNILLLLKKSQKKNNVPEKTSTLIPVTGWILNYFHHHEQMFNVNVVQQHTLPLSGRERWLTSMPVLICHRHHVESRKLCGVWWSSESEKLRLRLDLSFVDRRFSLSNLASYNITYS